MEGGGGLFGGFASLFHLQCLLWFDKVDLKGGRRHRKNESTDILHVE